MKSCLSWTRKTLILVTITHGCSLGAYHAANIAFRYPTRLQKLAAFSGRFYLTLEVEYFKNLFDGYYDDNIYFNNPTHYLPNLNDEAQLDQLRKMDIVLVVGKEDFSCKTIASLAKS